jgi:Mce-associated membrane protein
VTNADDALAAAEEAEAEAAEAEALAAAARARVRALRLRREADAAAAEKAAATTTAPTTEADETEADETEADETEAVEIDTPSDASGKAGAEADEESDAKPADEDAPKRRRRGLPAAFWKVAATVVTVLATVGLIALSVAMYVNHRQMDRQQELRAEFTAAARQGVVTLMSLDHTRAQQDVDAIVNVTTGDFKKDFESQAADMVKVAQENKVVTQVTVNAVAVQQMTDNTATVLLAAMSTVSNAASEKQEPRAWRLSVDVARDGDQIKLAKVEFVP